jgi:hypothetical protein
MTTATATAEAATEAELTHTSVTVPMGTLKAAALFAAKNDIRTGLNGVCLEVNSTANTVRLIATNGRVLGAFRVTDGDIQGPSVTAIIPAALIASLKARNEADITVRVGDILCAVRSVSLTCGETSVAGVTLNARFPQWQAVLPTIDDDAIAPASLNFEDLAVFVKAGKLLGTKAAPVARQQGTRGTLVLLNGVYGFVGVTMPWHESEVTVPAAIPAWALEA